MVDGVLAVGDSITNSCGFPTGNLPLASWAQWVSRGLSAPVTIIARPGATTADIRRDLLPEIDSHYRLALVYVGTNDLLKSRPVDAFAEDCAAVLERAAQVADTLLTMTLPLWVGRVPTVAPYGRRLARVYRYGAAIREAASGVGAIVAQAPELHGPRYVAADRIHPTAAGQLAFADCAAWALRDRGWTIDMPSDMAGHPDAVTTRESRTWVTGTMRQMVEAPLRQIARATRDTR